MDAPETITHGTEDDIRDKLVKLKPTVWRQEGNKLIGKTQMGTLVNFIPTDYILQGTDEDGNPILEKLDI